MSQKIKAIVFNKPGEVSIGEFQLAPCGPTELITKTLYTMVSSGTELRVFAGHYGAADKFPIIPGYSVIGEVIEVGNQVKNYRVGDLITGRNPLPVPGITNYWGGQASHHRYDSKGENRPILLPAKANPLDYVIVEISAISFRGVEAANPKKGESAIVLGQGLIGAFSAAWLHARGCRVLVADMEQGRLDRALAWGAEAAVKISDPDAMERMAAFSKGGADIVVESSGTAKGMKTAYGLVRASPPPSTGEYHVEPISAYRDSWPRLIVQANYLDEVSINPFSFFSGEGLIVLTPFDRGIEDREKVVKEISRGAIKASNFVQNMVSFTAAPEAYKKLRDDKNQNFSLVFDWTGTGK